MTNALNRAVQQLRAAQDASDKLNGFLEKRADAGHYVRQIATELATSLALLEASLMAAQPRLSQQINLGDPSPDESKTETAIWLDLGMG